MMDEPAEPAAEFDESDLISMSALELYAYCPQAPLGLRANPYRG